MKTFDTKMATITNKYQRLRKITKVWIGTYYFELALITHSVFTHGVPAVLSRWINKL